MKIFLDDENREWKLNLTWAKAEEIAQRCERPDSTPEKRTTFDLFNITDKEQIESFTFHDMYTGRFNVHIARCLVNILYVLCEQQCAERSVTDVQFGEMMGSGLFSRAWEAFMEELGNFIQDPEQMTMFQSLLYLAEGTRRTALQEVNQTLAQQKTALDVHVRQMITERVEKMQKEIETKLAKAAEDFGTMDFSNSAGLPGLSPAVT
jgi:DNA-binding transcriptional MerR regulator